MAYFRRKPECGSLAITAEQAWALPGERVTGAVVVHLDRALQDTVLQIALVGNERLHSAYCMESNSHPFSADHKLVDALMELHHGPLAAGDLVVPFSIQVPLGLPPSKEIEYTVETEDESSLLRVRIAYSLVCQLVVGDKKVESLSEKRAFAIAAWPAAEPVGEPREATAARTFHYAFMTKNGACSLRALLPTNVIRAGDRVAAHVWLALTPSERLCHVQLSLRRRIVPIAAKLKPHAQLGVDLCVARFTRDLLGDATEFVLHLNATEASAPVIYRKKIVTPFHPTESFRDFRVAYDIVVECSVRGCAPVVVRIPVTLLAPRADPTAVQVAPVA